MSGFDFWQMLAGLGLFLFAMAQLEAALRALGGRSFRNLLRRHTDRPLKAIAGGLAATAMLQSSSVVGLMLLAFIGAGLMSLPNALGVIFGSNLGTTLTGWIVATLGFKVELQNLSLPLVGIGALVFLFGKDKLAATGRAVLGLGLLLLGLGLMKSSVASLHDSVDIAQLAGYSAWQYFLLGAVFAAVIQSSSATIMITLTALNAGLLDLPSAVSIAIGADLGTTTTVLIGAIQGADSKKRVATADFLFNLVTDVTAFLMRLPLLSLIAAIGINDPLYALVAFHTLFNLIGIALFLPFIKPIAKFLEGFFISKQAQAGLYVGNVSATVSDAAISAINDETAHLIRRVIVQNMLAFEPPLPMPAGLPPVPGTLPARTDLSGSFEGMYNETKRLEGEILAFAAKLQMEPLEEPESARLNQLLLAVRSAMQSCKALKDVHHNLAEFGDSPRGTLNDYLDHFRSVMTSFYEDIFRLRSAADSQVSFEDIVETIQRVQVAHDHLHQQIYTDISKRLVRENEISSLLNVNRHILNSNIALLMALKDFHLNAEQAKAIGRLPGVG